MWDKPPFSIADNCAVDVRNLAAMRKWYKEKLGFHEAGKDHEEDTGSHFTDLCVSNNDAFLSLVQLEPGTLSRAHEGYGFVSGECRKIWRVEFCV